MTNEHAQVIVDAIEVASNRIVAALLMVGAELLKQPGDVERVREIVEEIREQWPSPDIEEEQYK